MAIKKFISWGRFRRDNTRLGCLLLFLLGVICVLCVCMNITYQEPEGSFLDYGSTWRSLLGLSGSELMKFAFEVVVIVMVLLFVVMIMMMTVM